MLIFSNMRSHLKKDEFKFVAITVMVMEVASFLVFIFGTLGAILGTYSGIPTTDFILLGFGGIFIALMLMAGAETLQIMMRIEYNTRKENILVAEQTQVQRATLAATKKAATPQKKRKTYTRKPAKRKPAVKKVKPRRKKK